MRIPRLLLAMLVSIAALVLPFFVWSSATNTAVAAQEPVQIGVIYTCANKSQFKVLSCENGRCKVFIINRFSPGGGFADERDQRTVLGNIKDYKCSTEAPVSVDPPGEPQIEFAATYACSDRQEFRVISCNEFDECKVQIINRASPDGGPVVGQNRKSIRERIRDYACSSGSRSAVANSGASVDAFETTLNTPAINARSIELLKPNLGAFTLLNASLKVELPSPLINLSILERTRDSAEGTYQGRNGIKVKLVSLSYPSVDVSLSTLDRIELEMRRGSSQVTILKRKKGRAFLVEFSAGRSFVAWGNSSWLFFSFGGAQEARSLAGSFGY